MKIKNAWQEVAKEEKLLPKGYVEKRRHLKKEDVIRKLYKRLA